MSATTAEAAAAMAQAELIHDAATVARAVDRMAEEIARDTRQADPILMCVMNGGLVLTGMLMPRLAFPLRVDYLHATRYRERTVGSDLVWRKQHEVPLRNETVVIVDDILDEGHTLDAIVAYCRAQGAARILTAVLVEKERERDADVVADYLGLKVPDRYVFGCGMDYKGYWRNADGIFATTDRAGGQAPQ